jgi:hypothetical protein
MRLGRSSAATANSKNFIRKRKLRCGRINCPRCVLFRCVLVVTAQSHVAPFRIYLTFAPSGSHILSRQKAQFFDDERQQKMPPPNETGQIPQLRARSHDYQPPTPTGKCPFNSQNTLAAFGSEIAVLRPRRRSPLPCVTVTRSPCRSC